MRRSLGFRSRNQSRVCAGKGVRSIGEHVVDMYVTDLGLNNSPQISLIILKFTIPLYRII